MTSTTPLSSSYRPVFSLPLRTEPDVAHARQRAREIAELLGLPEQSRIRLATAVSEIARNAVQYAHEGHVEYGVREPAELVVRIRDQGPGIADLDAVMGGRYRSPTGLGIGVVGARKLVNRLDVDTSSDGTVITLTMGLPPGAKMPDSAAIDNISDQLVKRSQNAPLLELQRQNHELLRTLEETRWAQEAAAAASRERDALLALVPAIVWRARGDGYADYFNPRWSEYTGMSLADSEGDGWQRALHPDDRMDGKVRWRATVDSGAPMKVEWRLRSADGQYRWHVMRAEPLTGDHEVTWYGSAVDIHDTVEREAESVRLAEFRERMLGIVSHDLRSPLAAILIAVELLETIGGAGTMTAKVADRIQSSANRALRMISALLDYTQAHLGAGVPIQPSQVDIGELLHEIVSENQALHKDNEIQLHLEGAYRCSLDRDRVTQALGNLLNNAVVHGAPGAPVAVHVRSEGGSVIIEVHNAGEPIPPERLEDIFEPFARGTAPGAPRTRRGLGLGLYIVREIARAHQGTVELTSDDGGTITRLRLPLSS